jgi:L-threonylcarbamoyladenylate synthase
LNSFQTINCSPTLALQYQMKNTSTQKACRVLPMAEGLNAALAELQRGSVIAFPTDTVYGVGADGLDAAAVLKLYATKDRPLTQPIPLLLADLADLALVSKAIPERAMRLAKRYWPGGLTLVVPAAPHLPPELLASGTTVAVRVPDYAPLRRLIRQLGHPLAATSANRHGAANPVTAQDVLEQLGSRLPLVLDGGPTPGDTPSTIIDLTGPAPRVLRQGCVAVDPALLQP